MLTIILHHSAMELISNSICNVKHKAVKNDSLRRNKKAEEILLDISVHQPAIVPNKLHFVGRPDLVHLVMLQYHFLMELLSTDLQKNIQLIVHTRKDRVFVVPGSWRIPVHFIRFRGLLEKFLLEEKLSLGEEVNLLIEHKTLGELLQELNPSKVINLVETGEKDTNLLSSMPEIIQEQANTVVLIGGYQRGEYNLEKDYTGLIEEKSLIEKPTTAWMIKLEILSFTVNLNKSYKSS